jgi:predicted Zn-dependent peptidase
VRVRRHRLPTRGAAGCVGVWYRVGSSDERAERTARAPVRAPVQARGPVGGYHYDVLKRAGTTEANASTSADRTAYHEVLPAHQLELALWIEADRMGYFAGAFEVERLITQQSVVRAERRQRYENVAYGAADRRQARAVSRGHPHRYLTIGRHDDIQAATMDDVLAFYRTWYVPANATLVVGGDVPANIDTLIDRYFGAFPASQRPPRRVPPPVSPAHVSEQITDRFAALGRIHRAWLGPAAFAADEAELDLLTTAWSAVGTGALWRRLVYETQLAQRVSAWTTNHRLGGELHVAVDLRTGADPAAVRAILDEECARGIDARAIERALTRREAGAIWGLTAVARRVLALHRFVLYTEQPDGLAADLLRYRAVTPASIDAAIARWLDPARMVEAETRRAPGRGIL